MKLHSRLTQPNSISSYARTAIAAALLILGAAMFSVAASNSGGGSKGAPNASTDNLKKQPAVDTSSVLVVLQGEPLSKNSSTKPAPGKKIDFDSTNVKSYRAQLAARRNDFKNWLKTYAPNAKVTSQYDISLNAVAVQLNGTSLATIKGAPMVQSVQYNALYHPDLSESHKIINAGGAWAAAGGRSNAGRGIKIGDIDTGIDETHPFFDPTGFAYPTTGGPWPKCDAADSAIHKANQQCEHVTPKVIVAKVFYNKAAVSGLDALAIQDHGTHTAGIAAGVTGKVAVVEGVHIDDMSGIAPGAWLGNYNVFPGGVLDARSEDILNAVEAAIADGMDVLNLSLGGGYHGNNDLLAIGLDNAVEAGVTVAVAAGNSGPGGGTVESPGRARNIITVGASTNQHFVGQPLTFDSTTVGAAVGEFDPLPTGTYEIFDTHSNGCGGVSADAAGKVAIIDRGTCTFSQKVANAKQAGAIGVIIINNVAGDPTAMARTEGFDDDIPAVMIGLKEGAALRASGATTVSAVATFREFITDNADILAGFSSQGPTNIDFGLKPDLTSVGVNVLSSITCVGKPAGCPDDGSGWAFFSGTSMSTPHIAGSAAVLLDISNKDWSPARIKSELVNRADLVVKDAKTGTHDVGPTAQGAGRENLSHAASGTTWLSPVSAVFGKTPASSARSVVITVYNPTGNTQTFTVSKWQFVPSTFGDTVSSVYGAGTIVSGDPRISVVNSFSVPAGGSYDLTVTLNPGSNGAVQGWIKLNGPGSNDLHFAYYAHVGP